MSFYHEGHRSVQARFSSSALADRLESVTHRTALTDSDRDFIGQSSFFFLATADAEGRPDCSYKGGAPGFVRAVSSNLIVFPDYDGNGMFRSLGNIEVNPAVGLLFIAMTGSPRRLRVNGHATVVFDDPLMQDLPGAQALVRIVPEHIFPNCPRYVHDAATSELSRYTPSAGQDPLEPGWKTSDQFTDVVPPRKA
ncbi:MAG: pyridoxamine 5'-phosphate oxidase family protein [Hyphomonas sp.]|uniref:pyridoxamine 5'-phosphate oxidase family protein n=1 Tax=Hyphomonas sp. TaxID=87 RepID=UPI003527908B